MPAYKGEADLYVPLCHDLNSLQATIASCISISGSLMLLYHDIAGNMWK